MADAIVNLEGDSTSGEYVVVARRYRPQTFDELIGQEHVAQALKQAINTGRIGHAYLFTGARGVGKTSAARILAKALNCVQGPTATPCNNCDVCNAVSTGDDVDVLEIDGASNRGIDEIRQLRQNAGIRPSRVRFKIYIIDEVHMLTKEAFNALLKTLEEPPEHVKFIFATTEPNKIPITILSRCQRFDFAGIESGSIQQRLAQIAQAEGVSIDQEALQILSVRAAGSMRDSQSLLEQLLAVAGSDITADEVNSLLGIAPAARIAELAKLLAARDAAASLSLLDATIRAGADVGQMMDQLMGYMRDVMAITVGCPAERMLYALPAQFEEAKELGSHLGVNTILAMLQILDQSAARMRVSLHERTLADMAIVRLAALEDLDALADVVAEIKATGTTSQPSSPAAVRPAPAAKRSVPVAPVSAPRQEETPPRVAQSAPSVTELNRDEATHAETTTDESIVEEPKRIDAAIEPASAPSAVQVVEPPPAPTTHQPASEPDRETSSEPNREPSLAEQMAAMTKQQTQAPPKPKQVTPAPAPSQESDGASLQEELKAMQRGGHSRPVATTPRPSRREVLAEVAQRPLVKKAMELFEVPPDRMKYHPPRDS